MIHNLPHIALYFEYDYKKKVILISLQSKNYKIHST